MIWIDRLAVVWGCVVALAILAFGRNDGSAGELFLAWLVVTVLPWALLHGLRWVVLGRIRGGL